MTSAVLWLLKYFENPKGPWGPGCQSPPEIRPFKTHNGREVLLFFLMACTALNIIESEGEGINLVTLREGTINVSAVNCFGDATALGGRYHRDKSPHRCTVHAHANPAISGGLVRPLTSSGLWFDCAGLMTALTGGQFYIKAFLKSFGLWADSVKHRSGGAPSKTIGFPLLCKEAHSGLQNSNSLYIKAQGWNDQWAAAS